MEWFGFNRRQKDRREGAGADRRQSDERQAQKRQNFRVIYPPVAAPKIVNLSAQVIDISIKAVKFMFTDHGSNNMNLDSGSKTDIVLKFHDGQTIEMTGTILRQGVDSAGKIFFICIFDTEMPATVINKEQAYLLKNFPDFCRDKFKF